MAILLIIWVCFFSIRCVSCIAQMSRSVIIFCISGNFLVVSPFTLSVEILILCCLCVRRSAYSVDVGVSMCERLVLSLCIGSVSAGKASRYSSVLRVEGSLGCKLN